MVEIRKSIDDEDGRYRAVLEVTVPGTPEEIWETIATGPGIEAWFVPADVEPRLGGRAVTHHGSYGDSVGIITAYDPPSRIAFDEADWQGPDTPVPTWNTEFLVEAVSGDSCVVRLSSGFLAGGDEWHDDVDQTLEGWTGALRILHLYLTHFAGQSVATLLVQQEVGNGTNPDGGQWDLVGLAGLRPAAVGREVATAAPVPPLAGVVEYVDDEQVFVRTHAPALGIAGLVTMHYEGVTSLVVQWYLYGDGGAAVRDEQQPAWSAWARGLTDGS